VTHFGLKGVSGYVVKWFRNIQRRCQVVNLKDGYVINPIMKRGKRHSVKSFYVYKEMYLNVYSGLNVYSSLFIFSMFSEYSRK